VLLHGYPKSSYMWGPLGAPRGRLARDRARPRRLRGFRARSPGTWERHVEAIERFRRELGIERCVLVVHDWGGLIGLRWACEHPDAVSALVISSTGFFPDGRWHGMAEALRTPGTGEEVVAAIDRTAFGRLLRAGQPIDERRPSRRVLEGPRG
jgi:haloalkane dehalogenase